MKHAYCQSTPARTRLRGFTLVELIVALTVVSAAMSALIMMFNAGLGLANQARNRAIAAELASGQLALLSASPRTFLWREDAADASGLFPINLSAEDPPAGNPVQGPEVRLASLPAQEKSDALYQRFRWKAWGRAIQDANVYEIVVSVHWLEGGRPHMLAMTSAIPRHEATKETVSAVSPGAAAL